MDAETANVIRIDGRLMRNAALSGSSSLERLLRILPTDALKYVWDAGDIQDEHDGKIMWGIHAEMNRRGEGEYVAI